MRHSFSSFPIIISERIILRQLSESDAAQIYILRSDEQILKYIDIPVATGIEDALAFIKKINNSIAGNESMYWGIASKDNNLLIGTICLWNISTEKSSAEIGYVLHPDHHGKGIMDEAIKKVIDYGFEKMELHSMEAAVHRENLRSINVLVKNNFRLSEEENREPENDNMVIYTRYKQVSF